MLCFLSRNWPDKCIWSPLLWVVKVIFLPQGKIALMVLKSYTNFPDTTCYESHLDVGRTYLLIVNYVNAGNRRFVWLNAGHLLSSDYQRRFLVIQTILEQGKSLFAGKKVSNRIVSIDRHHLRPIIRGKETKSVEFGAKVNNIQIDGISFIEHISFKDFNEGVRLKDCIRLQQQLDQG